MDTGRLTMQRQHGFTLVELVTVMIIIGLIGAVAIPRVFNNQRFDNRGYYTEVITAVRYAQQLAVAINCNTQVSLIGNSYTVTLDDNPMDCDAISFTTDAPNPVTGQAGFSTVPANFPRSTTLPNIIAVPNTFIFNALGQANSNVNVNVGDFSFRIHQATGYIEQLP